ncbi:rhodanese-like domain-containing protein [Olleya sp. Bg11-27]|uniref:rhodanese-like domain-containing protein n=1 Tax=Olleya sp. Bg11-27 TaxID=2058135 RepID=UPI000C312E2D|nr:rhodanese-like domain-containing protein [Olleya sp. Bg11-27]AUC77768.1 rhodanese-like domain-containing protein [Olleya sp. Bg11-27]
MKTVLFLFISLFTAQSIAQDTLDELLKKHNKNSVPYITVQELAMPKTDAVILDAREPKEFEVSHIKNAMLVGYDFFDIKTVTEIYSNKDEKIVVYCSLGIRSETIAKKLKDEGYTNVLNLYGGIFEWKNNDFIVVDSEEKETNKVHTFNEAWSKWLEKGDKIYEEEPITEKKKTRNKSKK